MSARGRMVLAPLLALTLVLAACQSREVVAICAAEVAAETGVLTVARHAADGAWTRAEHDPAADTRSTRAGVSAEPMLPALWRIAENTMRVLTESEASPCGEIVRAAVTVSYDDGSEVLRVTTCEGNALSRVAREVLAAAEVAAEGQAATPMPAAGLPEVAEACGRLP